MARLNGTTQTIDVEQDIDTTYGWVVHPNTPIALVNRWGPLPGFDSYELVSGDWTDVGSSRRVTLSDGSQATETITTIDQPAYFDYELTEFSSAFLKLAFKRAYGQWWFTANDDGGTHVVWRYSLEAHTPVLTPFVWIFVKTLYRAYVKAAVQQMRTISIQEGLKPRSTSG